MKHNPQIYIIAGEASGDFIGSQILLALQRKLNGHLPFCGVGGERMQQTGLRTLFPMQELSLMGFAEVVPHIRHLKRRIHETVTDIVARKPDVLVTIDSPGFTYRVVSEVKKQMENPPVCVHVVAPTVWAYKPKRSIKTAALFDHLLVLLPFEPPYFSEHGLKTDFIGHPVAWEWRTHGNGEAFRQRHGIAHGRTLLGMMPGSRANEINRHLPVFMASAEALAHKTNGLEVVIPLRPAMEQAVRQMLKGWPLHYHLIIGDDEKKDAFAACQLALAKSGTVALETALAYLPTVTAYSAHAVSAWLVRRMIKVPYVNLVNILLKREVIPECIQENCTPAYITPKLQLLLEDEQARHEQLAVFATVGEMLGAADDLSPAEKAAGIIAGYC